VPSSLIDRGAGAVYTNGKFYTVNGDQPWVEAVAIKDGAFIAVGTAKDVNATVSEDTRTAS